MKRFIAFFLAMILITAVLVGCKKQSVDILAAAPSTSDSSQSTESTAVTSIGTDSDTEAEVSDTESDSEGSDSSAESSETEDTSLETSAETSEETMSEETTSKETTSEETASEETAKPTQTTTEEDEEEPITPMVNAKEHLDILFIGNSFTYYNDLPKVIFKGICDAAGYDVTVDQVTKGAWNLYKFSMDTDEMGSQVHQKLNSKKYDIVVIQEQSSTPIKNPAQFYTSVRRMLKLIEENGATPLLYETWGYHEDYSQTATCGGSTTVMEMKLRAAYTAIGDELDIKVAYSGTAMLDAYKKQGLNVYDKDLHHSSVLGSTVSALTIFARIFGVDPRTVSYNGTLNASDVAKAKESAYKATFVDHKVLPTYKTSSVGVALKGSDTIDVSKTKNLAAVPTSSIISVISRNSAETGNGWQPFKTDATKTFSGIRGTKDAIAATVSTGTLSAIPKNNVANIEYGVSVKGVSEVGADNAIANLVNGHWGNEFMANITFDTQKYNVKGETSSSGEFTGLITLNFGSVHTFDAIGYMSGSMYGFPQVQKVYVSDDGKNWTLVESACYDTIQLELDGKYLVNLGKSIADPWDENKPGASTFFDMGGVSGQYIRIGIVAGRSETGSALGIDLTAVQNINTREIVVFGS